MEFAVHGKVCAVTGAVGFVGRRLVEMLLELEDGDDKGGGAVAAVVAMDVTPPPEEWKDPPFHPRLRYHHVDITRAADVSEALRGVDCVWHNAALVGPYFSLDRYMKVNYEGTLNIIAACKEHGISRVVMSSSPSTRFDGLDICGKREDELIFGNGKEFPDKFLQPYAESKAMGEKALRDANDGTTFFTVAVAPHQVYGPRDMLFLHNLLLPARDGKLRIFGSGDNLVSFCYVDNYCHGLILAMRALFPSSPVLGKFYIVTDGAPVKFWSFLDKVIVRLGYPSLKSRMALPIWLMMPIAQCMEWLGSMMGKKFRLNRFAVRMLVIHRYFDISNAERDLKYQPAVDPDTAFERTMEWFGTTWYEQYGEPGSTPDELRKV